MNSADDELFMRRAIALAAQSVGRTGENPSVGCVLVKDGMVIAEAATAEGGRPHAEEQAIEFAGPAAAGATAYVTLEPCGARSSGGASCSELLVRAGVARVVVACADPSKFAAGQGAGRLASAGVRHETGLLAEEAQAALYMDYRPAS